MVGAARRGGAAVSAAGAVEETAPAKANLGLSVLARRGDGFHEIETVMVRLDLHDTLHVRPGTGGVSLEVEGAELPTDERNLAVRAARLYLEAAGSGAGVALRLHKRIPVAAGLGGGSSDAAATLRAMQRLIPAEVELERLALELGSDVPFFLAGMPAALARGRGERLAPATLPPLALVLACPGEPVSAGEAYASLQSFTARIRVDVLAARLRAGDDPGLVNALQPGVVRAHPVVREVVRALRGEALRGVTMSGSGSCCFGLAQDPHAAAEAAARLAAAHPGWTVTAARSA